MSTLNASSIVNGQQRRNGLSKNSDHFLNQDVFKDPNASFRHQMVAQVCCSQTNCERVKIEAMPEGFFHRKPDQAFMTANPDGRDAPLGKKEGHVNVPEPYIPYPEAFCPCVINKGPFVTYCCVRRDCDDASKIDGVRERPRSYSHFKF